MASVVLGIDLGTTNTCVAVWEAGKPRVISSVDGTNTIPSAVALTDSGEWLVGSAALRQRVAKPTRTVTEAKRLLGRGADEIARLQPIYPFTLAPHKGNVGVKIGEKEYSIPELSAVVLDHVKERAEKVLGVPIKEAVITVPAHFNERQRQATRDAGLIAGLKVRKIISEPTAAAVAYGMGRGEGKKVLVFDLGGGTFDVTVIHVKDKSFKVLATGGDAKLGGADFDTLLVDFLVDQFIKQHPGVDPRQVPESLSRLQEAAEKAKCELSTTVQSPINLPFIAVVNGQPAHLETTVNRAFFEQLAHPLIARCITAMKNTLGDAKLKFMDINEVLLVGGMTRMPKIAAEVQTLTGKPPSKGINPDEAVAVGAATVGQWIAEDAKQELIDVVPLPLGLTLSGGRFGVLVQKNTPLPVKVTKPYTTSKDKQRKIKIHVRQGESEEAKENILLGAFNLILADEQPKGKPKIEVTFELDKDGILNVTAEDKQAGKRGKVLIRPQEDEAIGIEEEIRKAEVDTAAFDKAKKELAAVEGLFAQLGGGISGAERADIDGKLRALRSAIVEQNLPEVNKLLPEVTQLGAAHMAKLRGG
ncbi:MAG: Hsp70 family protein [Chrysiogenetes bacterium]|nr:Hsp70 family protein [Chrysiogenetes bacterium]